MFIFVRLGNINRINIKRIESNHDSTVVPYQQLYLDNTVEKTECSWPVGSPGGFKSDQTNLVTLDASN